MCLQAEYTTCIRNDGGGGGEMLSYGNICCLTTPNSDAMNYSGTKVGKKKMGIKVGVGDKRKKRKYLLRCVKADFISYVTSQVWWKWYRWYSPVFKFNSSLRCQTQSSIILLLLTPNDFTHKGIYIFQERFVTISINSFPTGQCSIVFLCLTPQKFTSQEVISCGKGLRTYFKSQINGYTKIPAYFHSKSTCWKDCVTQLSVLIATASTAINPVFLLIAVVSLNHSFLSFFRNFLSIVSTNCHA